MSTTEYQRIINYDIFLEILSSLGEESIFSSKEIELYGKKRNPGSYAARYLIKKELIDILSIDCSYTDIEILNTMDGKPFLNLSKELRIKAESEGICNCHISISHSKERAAALIIIEKNEV